MGRSGGAGPRPRASRRRQRTQCKVDDWAACRVFRKAQPQVGVSQLKRVWPCKVVDDFLSGICLVVADQTAAAYSEVARDDDRPAVCGAR